MENSKIIHFDHSVTYHRVRKTDYSRPANLLHSLTTMMNNYNEKRDAEVIEQRVICPLTDIIPHAFLPKATPDSVQENLDIVEDNLLEMASISISSVLKENGLEEKLEPVKLMFEKWIEIQPKGLAYDCTSFVEQFQKGIADLKPGHAIPLYVKKQNATMLITKTKADLQDDEEKNKNEKIEIATFRTSLPSKVIMSNVNSLTMAFPETCEVIRNTDLFTSTNFLQQLFELITEEQSVAMPTVKRGDYDYSDTRDVPEPFLVSDWIIGCLAPEHKEQSAKGQSSPGQGSGISLCKKKIRDQVNLKTGRHSSSKIPFRRSGMWLSIKVALQLKLLEIFGDDREKADFLFKIIILRILTDICEKFLNTTRMNLDLASQMVAKVGRRVLKLEDLFLSLEDTADTNKETVTSWKSKCLEHTDSIMKQVTDAMGSLWKKIYSAGSTKESQSGPTKNGHQKEKEFGTYRTKEEFLEDLNHDIPWLTEMVKMFQENSSSTLVDSYGGSGGIQRPTKIERFSTLNSILEGSKNISNSTSNYFSEKYDNLKALIWLHDTETFVKFHLQQSDTTVTSTLLQLATKYLKIARDVYKDGNPVGTSQILLVILKIHQELDKVATKNYPILKQYRSGVNSQTFDKLVLPHWEDMQLLDDILDYFDSRDQLAVYEGVMTLSSLDATTFGVRFAQKNPVMKAMKELILNDTQIKVEAKYEEIRRKREICENLMDQIEATVCECRWELQQTKSRRKNWYMKNVKVFHCDRCKLQSKLSTERTSVETYERPLPLEDVYRDAIVFELLIPKEISDWRDSLSILKWELLGETVFATGNTKMSIKIKDYRKLKPYLIARSSSQVICLGSTHVPASGSYYSYGNKNPDVVDDDRDDFIRDNGLKCVYNYQRENDWPKPIESVRKACAYRLQDASNSSPYWSLQSYLKSTDHTQNQVMASQNRCHQMLSLDEFIAFGSLRAGHRIQLRNLYRSISGRTLSLEEESVVALIMQALWQIEKRDAHLDFQDDKAAEFCLEFLEMLEKLVDENKSNYSNPLVLLNAIVITTRIMELNKTVGCQSKCYNVLKVWRHEVIDEWVAKIEAEIAKPSTKEDAVSSLRKNLLLVRLCSAFSFNVVLSMTDDLSNIRNVMRDHDDVFHWLHTIHDLKEFTDLSSLSGFCRMLLQLASRVALRLNMSKVIFEPGMSFIPEALHSFAVENWTGAADSNSPTEIKPISSSAIEMTYSNSGNHKVTFDLILGSFLVNGFSQSQLPDEVASDPLFQRFFKDNTKLRVQRESPSDTRTTSEFHGKNYIFTSGYAKSSQNQLTFGFNRRSRVVLIKEIHEDSGNIWVMIDSTKFNDFVPSHLAENYSHWLDVNNEEIQFRRLPKTDVDYERPPDFTLKRGSGNSSWKMVDNVSKKQLLSIGSPGFLQVTDALRPLELKNYIDVLVDVGTDQGWSLTAHLRRHNLRFTLSTNDLKSLESVEYPGFHLSSDQTSSCKGTLIGLRNGVLLQNDGVQKKTLLIMPHGDIKIQAGSKGHQKVTVDLDNLRQPSFFMYEYDDVLRRIKTLSKSKSAWLYLAALHGATSSPLPDPFTELTGTEMAVRILQTAFVWSCSPYDKESMKTLEFIRGMAPKRIYSGVSEIRGGATSKLKKLLGHGSKSVSKDRDKERIGSMESTEWPQGLPSMAAYDGFSLIVEKLIEDSLKLRNLYKGQYSKIDLENLEHSTETLQLRGYLRSLLFYNSAAHLQSAYRSETMREIVENTQFFEPPEIPKLRSTSKPGINLTPLLQISATRLNVDAVPTEMNFYDDLKSLLLKPKTLQALHPAIHRSELSSLQTLFSWDIRASWLKLYDWAISKKSPEDELSFTLLLEGMAYRGATLEQVNTIHVISTLAKSGADFPPVPVPSQGYTYTDPTASSYVTSEVNTILKNYARKFNKSYSDFENDWTKLAEARESYQEKITSDCRRLSTHLSSKWPFEAITDLVLPEVSGLHFETGYYWNKESRQAINERLYFWYQNHQLALFLEKVQKIISKALEGVTLYTMVTPNLSEVSTLTEYQTEYNEPIGIDLDDILESGMNPEILFHLERIYKAGKFIHSSDGSNSGMESLLSERNQIRSFVEDLHKMLALTTSSAPLETRIGHLVGFGPRTDPGSILKILLESEDEVTTNFAGGVAVLWTHLKRLNRCLAIHSSPGFSPESPEFQREMENPGHQNWSPAEYPEWLLLELELDIMIRGVQVKVAQQMMSMPENNGNGVMQLNMGEGKTSVIVPMLCAALASTTEGSLCRVTVLSSMFNMNMGILASAIGGLLNRRVYTFPCRRDMDIDGACVDAIQDSYEECLEMKGVVLTLPEYRLSFRLLAYDKMFKEELALGLKLHSVEDWLRRHCRDILDESDELLGVKYQLVYTVGEQVPIDGGDIRWNVCKKLLQIVQQLGPQLLKTYGSSMIEFDDSDGSKYPHTFTSVRLLHNKVDTQTGSKLARSFLADFAGLVADHILESDFMLTEEQREVMKKFLVDTEISPEVHRWVIQEYFQNEDPAQLQKILVISGYLRRGVLTLALGKRWRVEYGVDSKVAEGQHRLMAVPFRAKDVAAEKTEFGHPDLAIVLTHLSYYYSGLNEAQLMDTFGILKGKRDPDSLYKYWLSFIRDEQIHPTLKNYQNISLKDVGQRSKLFTLLSHHKPVIDYWLSHKVFPKESKQFPGKLLMTSWDLCYERKKFPVCGFSGTNDSQILLPLQITQQDLPELMDTNAKVEETLLQPENEGHRGFAMGVSCHQILEQMKEDNLTILIDAGALMLECSNEEVAELWLEVNPDLEAVVYFSKDNELLVKTKPVGDIGNSSSRKKYNCGNRGRWYRKDQSHSRDTQQGTPFDLSPYQGRLEKCGVFLDDQHTRGTDLKFPLGSRACVTIGSRMKRDKLIQACMRMRKLGSGHSVTFYLTHEVTDKIYGSPEHKIETEGVLDWVRGNTREFNQDGLLYWAIAGKYYAQRLAAEDNFRLSNLTSTQSLKILASQCVDDEVIKLRNMYGQFTELGYLWELVPQWFKTAKDRLILNNEKAPLAPEVIQKFDSIGESIKSKVLEVVPNKKHFFTSDGGMMEEEQEKELEYEQEIEVEEERQVQRPRSSDPAVHHLHQNVVNALLGKHSKGFEVIEGIHRLPDIFKDTTFWKEVQPEGWSGDVFATKDFITVIRGDPRYYKTDMFLRPLEYLASTSNTKNGKIQFILLSPYEVNEMMPWFRNPKISSRLNLFSTRRADKQNLLLNRLRLQLPQGQAGGENSSLLTCTPNSTLASLLLASGSLYFESMEEQKAFARFLSLVPKPWTHEETRLFEQGIITKSAFLLREIRDQEQEVTEENERSFRSDPTGLVRHILKCRHPVVSQVSHVQCLLDEKCYVEILEANV